MGTAWAWAVASPPRRRLSRRFFSAYTATYMSSTAFQQLKDEYGITPLINAGGPNTAHSGSRMRPEALAAIEEAHSVFLSIEELMIAAGDLVAKTIDPSGKIVAGAVVCSGAAAGMSLMAAAALSGRDPAAISRLPRTDGRPNQLVVQAAHQVAYDVAWRLPGAELVPVGRVLEGAVSVPDGGWSAEHCECSAAEFEAAITPMCW